MKTIYSLVFLLMSVINASGQSLPNFEQYTDDDGLSNGFVTCLYQDKQGFMWFGTANGVNRFEGYQFKSWTTIEGQSNSLSNPTVWAIHGTTDGIIWIGTDKGLNRFDPRSETFTQYFHDPKDKQTLSHDHVYNMCSDQSGNLWISTENGLNLLKKGSTQFIRYFVASDPKGKKGLGGLTLDETGTLWFGIKDTLIHFYPKSGNIYRYTLPSVDDLENEFANHVRTVFLDKTGKLWVGTDKHGFYLFDRKNKQFKAHFQHNPNDKNSLSDDRLCFFLAAEDGRIWVGTYGGGLNIFDPKNLKIQRVEIDPFNPVHHNFDVVRRMLKDQAGNMWLGTSYGGTKVALKHRKPFTNYQPIPGKPGSIGDGQLGQLSESADGSIWTPVDGWGLAALQPQTDQFIPYTPEQKAKPALDTKNTVSVLEDSGGQVWALTFTEFWTRNKTSKQWRNLKPSGIPVNWLSNQLKDSKGRHWIGSQGGFFQYDPTQNAMIRIPLINKKNSLTQGDNQYIENIYEDPSGAIWIGTHAGLNYSRDGVQPFAFYPFQSPILNILMSKTGTLWLGTIDGLAYFNPQSKAVAFHPKANTLQGKLAHTILEDEKGRLWIGSRIGLICLDPKTGHTRIYNQKDGVASKQFFNSALKARNGEMYFGGIKGLLRFDPNKIRNNDFIPGIVLTNLQVLNRDMPIGGSIGDTLDWKSPLQKNIAYTDTLKLLHRQNDFALEFAALDYTAAGNNRYKYQLLGYDQHWIETDANRRFAHYTNLNPGWYQFKVMGSNNDGVWNQDARVLHIHILPPWWARWWAYLLWFAVLSGLVYLGWHYELGRRLTNAEASRLQQMDELKSRLYTNITHEFRTPLTVILGVNESLQSTASEDTKVSLEVIHRNGSQLLDLVNQMLDLAKLESGSLTLNLVQGDVLHYLRYLVESFHSLATNKGVSLEFITDSPELIMDFDPQRLQQIIANLLSNAIKFSPAGGKVEVQVRQQGKLLEIAVRDNGDGIPEDKLSLVFDRFYQVDDTNTRKGEGTGIGLTLVKELVGLMKGSVSASNREPHGAEFKVVLPMVKDEATKKVLQVENSYPVVVPKPLAEITPSLSPQSDLPLVLIVEDNRDVVRYLQSCFNGAYQILYAKDGQEGIDMALEYIPDLIISDIMMPEKDGYELCRTLKNTEASSHIPIVLLTAKADLEAKIEGLQKGADAYLYKPFHKEELLITVSNLLEVRLKLQAHYLHQAGLTTTKDEQPQIPNNSSLELAMEHAFIQKIKTLVEADFSKQWDVPELARALQVSISQLHRKLTALTGMHTTEFVRYVRLVKAREKLRSNREEKIAVIAYEVGFTSPNEFTRRFKEVFGVTPGEWRKQ
jgi:signal transduction histidine kinase/ligand-binding sensor domain-containing protein/DNA-binding response OmpR family regulator